MGIGDKTALFFTSQSEDNLKEAIKGIGEHRRFVVMLVELYSSDGNKYCFSEFDFDHEPNEEELLACATKDFDKHVCGISDEYTPANDGFEKLKAEEIGKIMDSYIVVDTEKLSNNQ